ncbi:MAG: hypothetical protein U1E70_22100 [Acetobacteraceae bacterium]
MMMRRWFVLILAIGLPVTAARVQAASVWEWHYRAPGIDASGTLVTGDAPDAAGFYQVTSIQGQRNGVDIIALQPAGMPIPGNEPYAVDNLLRTDPPHLTKHGIGFALRDGSHTNPFYADFKTPPVYLEFYAKPGDTAERPVVFSAVRRSR